VEQWGSTPPRTEKSKRLTGNDYQFTLSQGSSTEIKDAEVLRIKRVCEPEIFEKLFREETAYKLAKGALDFLAGTLPEAAPRNLRRLFARAFSVKPRTPSLTIKKLVTDEEAAG
jgi:hypothetical protein